MPVSEHELLACSGSYVWGNCSGAVFASAGRPPEMWDIRSETGTAAHWLSSEVLGAYADHGTAISPASMLGETAPNGVVIDEEIVEGVTLYVDHVIATRDAEKAGTHLLVEHKVMCTERVHPNNGGTFDSALLNHARCHVDLWDYKHGHRPVYAFECMQAINYLIGIGEALALNGYDDQLWTASVHIVQPFAYRKSGPVDTWHLKMSDLRPFATLLAAQAHEAMTNPTLTAGAHCRDCPGLLTCTAASNSLYTFMDYVRQPYSFDGVRSSESLAAERALFAELLPVAKARLEAADDELKHRMKNGEAVQGLSVESGQGNLAWTVSPQFAAEMAAQFGVDIKRVAVDTPTQAANKVPSELKTAFKSTIAGITARNSTGLRIINTGDSRVARAFKNQ